MKSRRMQKAVSMACALVLAVSSVLVFLPSGRVSAAGEKPETGIEYDYYLGHEPGKNLLSVDVDKVMKSVGYLEVKKENGLYHIKIMQQYIENVKRYDVFNFFPILVKPNTTYVFGCKYYQDDAYQRGDYCLEVKDYDKMLAGASWDEFSIEVKRYVDRKRKIVYGKFTTFSYTNRCQFVFFPGGTYNMKDWPVGTEFIYSDFQVEKGNIPTEYEPYQNYFGKRDYVGLNVNSYNTSGIMEFEGSLRPTWVDGTQFDFHSSVNRIIMRFSACIYQKKPYPIGFNDTTDIDLYFTMHVGRYTYSGVSPPLYISDMQRTKTYYVDKITDNFNHLLSKTYEYEYTLDLTSIKADILDGAVHISPFIVNRSVYEYLAADVVPENLGVSFAAEFEIQMRDSLFYYPMMLGGHFGCNGSVSVFSDSGVSAGGGKNKVNYGKAENLDGFGLAYLQACGKNIETFINGINRFYVRFETVGYGLMVSPEPVYYGEAAKFGTLRMFKDVRSSIAPYDPEDWVDESCAWFDLACILRNGIAYIILNVPIFRNIYNFVNSSITMVNTFFGFMGEFAGMGTIFAIVLSLFLVVFVIRLLK